jgi:7-keto-8-aminopelargonate synthetase-like enzyme
VIERCRRSGPSSSSTVLPAALAAACLQALDIARSEPERRRLAQANAPSMRDLLRRENIDTVAPDSPILALLLPDPDQAKRLSSHLLAHGLRAPYFSYGSEPRKNLLRTMGRSVYTAGDIERFGDALRTWGKKV